MRTEIVGWGKLKCLHCGEDVDLDGDIHLCNAPRNEWLNKQDKAFIQLPNGELLALK